MRCLLKFGAVIAAVAMLSQPVLAEIEVDLPEVFDYMGPTSQIMLGPDDRKIEFADTGPADGIPVLFIGGGGTSATVVQITDFLKSLREDLNIRLISVGRPGYGRSDDVENWTFDDFGSDAAAVLDKLGVDQVSIVAISAGGPHAAGFAAAHPDRVRSIHLAVASALVTRNPNCGNAAAMAKSANFTAAFPQIFWSFGDDSPTLKIPGFETAAANDGARTNAIAGQMGDGTARLREMTRFCVLDLADVSKVTAPVYLYVGMKDTVVPPVNADHWENIFQNVKIRRDYPDGKHDIQYRHWDQILVDIAGLGNQIVMCQDGSSVLVPGDDADAAQEAGATLGICAWAANDN